MPSFPAWTPSRGLPIYSTRDPVRPRPREPGGGPGEAQPHLSWGPNWCPRWWTSLEHALFNLLAFGRSPPTEVKVLRARGTPRAGGGRGTGVFPLLGFRQELGTRSLLAQPRSTRCLAGHWGPGCRPRFTGAAVMDVG